LSSVRNTVKPRRAVASSSLSDKIFYPNTNKKQRVRFSNPLFLSLTKH
jgi:hypothetical protein